MPFKLNASFTLSEDFNLTPAFTATGFSVVRSTVEAMIKEYRDNAMKLSSEALKRRFPTSSPPIEETKHTWVSRKEIEAFFVQNSTASGMRIYFAAHNQSPPVGSNLKYDQGQLTVILVATEDVIQAGTGITFRNDLLKDDDSVSLANPYQAMGDDEFPLCPRFCPTGTSL